MNLNSAMATMGASGFLCDLDDTFLHTNRIFAKQIELFCTAVHLAIPTIPQQEITRDVQRLNNEVYKKYAVKSTNWELIANELIKIYGAYSREVIQNALVFMTDVYKTVPELRDGAIEFLREVKDQQIPLAIITHGNEAWTQLKINAHDLHFYIEGLNIVPEEVHKSSSHWQAAIDALDMQANEVIAIGDSILTDMWPAHECGINKLIWVDKPDGWGLYRQGSLPASAIAIKEIPEVIPLVCSLPWV